MRHQGNRAVPSHPVWETTVLAMYPCRAHHAPTMPPTMHGYQSPYRPPCMAATPTSVPPAMHPPISTRIAAPSIPFRLAPRQAAAVAAAEAEPLPPPRPRPRPAEGRPSRVPRRPPPQVPPAWHTHCAAPRPSAPTAACSRAVRKGNEGGCMGEGDSAGDWGRVLEQR